MFALVAMAGLAKEIKMNDSRGDRHLGYSSRHTQVSVPATTNDMKAKVDALLSAYPSIDVTAMGFPRGWESEPLWQ